MAKEIRQVITEERRYKLEKARSVITIIFMVILVAQIFVFGQVKNLGNAIVSNLDHVERHSVIVSDLFIRDTIRAQERLMLNSTRQAWVQYLATTPSTTLLVKDKYNKYVMKSPNGDSFLYNPATMIQVVRPDNYFDIKDKNTDQILTQQVRSQWNLPEVKRILDVIASPVKAFGTTGDVLIYDSYTGEILVDNSRTSSNSPEIFSEDGKKYVQLLHLHPNNKNPKAVESSAYELMWRKDSDRNSNMIGYFNESTDMGSEGNNFNKYPLGEYNREFREKVLLPYETVGVEGQAMQITIVLGAQEQEIVAPYRAVIEEMKESQEAVEENIKLSVLAPIASVVLSLLVILLGMYVLRINVFFCKNSGCDYTPRK